MDKMIKFRKLKFHNQTYAIEITFCGKVKVIYLPKHYKG